MDFCDPNSFLHTFTYDVGFLNGKIKEHSANVINENTHAQEDDDSHDMQVLDSIGDYRKDMKVVDKADARIYTENRQHLLCHTTSGWSLLIKQKNG